MIAALRLRYAHGMDAPVTELLAAWRAGDTPARDALVTALYPELRRLAQQIFRRERSDHTLQPTALVNEAWLRLSDNAPTAADRSQLFAVAARLMREILIDHARARAALKRDGGERVTLSAVDVTAERTNEIDLIALDDALNRLERLDANKARIVELRYFGGLTVDETSKVLGQSQATVKRHWQAARVWLYDALGEEVRSTPPR